MFKFTPLIAPVKATVFPLVQKQQLNDQAAVLSTQLTAAGLSNIIDTTGACVCGFGELPFSADINHNGWREL